MRGLAYLAVLPMLLGSAVILDRIAVVAGNDAIKMSDIERDIRLTDFINGAPLAFAQAAKHASAERLITQEIIRGAIINGGYSRPPESQAANLEAQIRRTRFADSDERMRDALKRYGITGDELRAHLLWQLTVLDYINQRFRVGVIVTDQDIREYYDRHQAQLRKEFPRDHTLEALTPKIKAAIEAERVNQNFDEWLDQSRKSFRVEYKDEAIR